MQLLAATFSTSVLVSLMGHHVMPVINAVITLRTGLSTGHILSGLPVFWPSQSGSQNLDNLAASSFPAHILRKCRSIAYM